jgi:hypothetical protein
MLWRDVAKREQRMNAARQASRNYAARETFLSKG